jgi:hypothetical protein
MHLSGPDSAANLPWSSCKSLVFFTWQLCTYHRQQQLASQKLTGTALCASAICSEVVVSAGLDHSIITLILSLAVTITWSASQKLAGSASCAAGACSSSGDIGVRGIDAAPPPSAGAAPKLLLPAAVSASSCDSAMLSLVARSLAPSGRRLPEPRPWRLLCCASLRPVVSLAGTRLPLPPPPLLRRDLALLPPLLDVRLPPLTWST